MGHISRTFPKSNAEVMASPTRRGLPRALDYGHASTTEYTQALDNFHRVFGIRQGDHVVMLTDPLLDPRVVQVIQGLAKARKQQGPLLCEAIGGGRGRGRCQKLRQRVKQLLLVGKHRGLVTRRRRRGRAAIDRMRRSHGQVELGERVGMKEAVRQQGRRHGGDAGWAPCRAGKQPQQWACDAEHRTTDTRCDDDEHAGR